MYVGGVMSDHVLPEMGGPRWIGRNIGLRAPMSTPTQYTVHRRSTHRTTATTVGRNIGSRAPISCARRWRAQKDR